MKSNKPLAILTGLVAIWTVALAVHLGCDSTGLTQAPGLAETNGQSVKVTAFLSDKPMYFAPNSSATRSNFVDVSSQIPPNARSALFTVRPEFIDLTVDQIPPRDANGFTIRVSISDRLGGDRELVGIYDMEVDESGSINTVMVTSEVVTTRVIDILKGGEGIIEIGIDGDFVGEISMGQAEIDIQVGGSGNSNGNDNTGGNTNDNTSDNTNDNTGDNTNDNTGDNTNDNTGDNTNDNTGDNTNDNIGDNTNDNSGDNTNDNTDDNMNDNVDDGVCADGSIQLRTRIQGSNDFEVEVEYRENGENCRRFRLDIEGFPTGWHDVFANDVFVGEIFADSEDGEGRLRLETDDGNMPADFPFLVAGDIVSIGDVIDVTLAVHCSEIWSCDNANGNDNTGGNTNDNTGGNTNDNTGDNSNDNTGDNTNMNG